MRFHPDSDEEVCGATILRDERPAVACLRRQGHSGEHVAMARDAGSADGVCFYCRMPVDKPHRKGCVRLPDLDEDVVAGALDDIDGRWS